MMAQQQQESGQLAGSNIRQDKGSRAASGIGAGVTGLALLIIKSNGTAHHNAAPKCISSGTGSRPWPWIPAATPAPAALLHFLRHPFPLRARTWVRVWAGVWVGVSTAMRFAMGLFM